VRALYWSPPYHGVSHLKDIPSVRGQATVILHGALLAEAWIHVAGTGFNVPGTERTFHGPEAGDLARKWAERRARDLGLLPGGLRMKVVAP